MEIKRVGRFELRVELTGEHGMLDIPIFDVIGCTLDGHVIDQTSGCLGDVSARYWEGRMRKKLLQLTILYDATEHLAAKLTDMELDDDEVLELMEEEETALDWIRQIETGKRC